MANMTLIEIEKHPKIVVGQKIKTIDSAGEVVTGKITKVYPHIFSYSLDNDKKSYTASKKDFFCALDKEHKMEFVD